MKYKIQLKNYFIIIYFVANPVAILLIGGASD